MKDGTVNKPKDRGPRSKRYGRRHEDAGDIEPLDEDDDAAIPMSRRRDVDGNGIPGELLQAEMKDETVNKPKDRGPRSKRYGRRHEDVGDIEPLDEDDDAAIPMSRRRDVDGNGIPGELLQAEMKDGTVNKPKDRGPRSKRYGRRHEDAGDIEPLDEDDDAAIPMSRRRDVDGNGIPGELLQAEMKDGTVNK